MALIDLDAYEPPAPEPRGIIRSVGDTALQFGKGAVSGVRMLSDTFGADNAVSGKLRSATEALDGLLSAAAQQDQRRISEIMQEAEGKGWGEQIVAGLKAAGVAPGALLAQGLGTAAPTIAASLIPGVGPAAVASRIGAAGLGMAQGAGSIKGSIYETTKAELIRAGATDEEAEARAVAAQEYTGPNTGQIALGAGLGALAGSTGAERAVSALRNGITKAPAGLIGRVAQTGLTEAVPEFLQGGQEKLATNTALANEGFDVDPTSGIVANATLEGLAGFGVGAGFGIKAPRENRPPEEKPAAPLLLGNTPDPIIVFPDGTAGRRADLEAYINGLPEDQQVAARAKLMGMGARDATPEDILKAPDADSAIAAFTASLTGTDMGAMLGQDNPLIGASREMQAQAAADEADLADLVRSESRDLNTLRALTAEDARKQQELDALQATGTGQFGIPPEARPAVEQAATLEAPSIMQLALQRAQQRAAPQPVATTVPEVEQGLAAAKQELAAAAPAPIQRQPDILPGDISRNDGKPFQTENGARLKQREAGGIDGSEIVPVQGGFVVRPKATAANPAAAAPGQAAGVQPAASGVPAPVDAAQQGLPALNPSTTGETPDAQAAQAVQSPPQRQEPAAGAAPVAAPVPDPGQSAEGGAVPAQAKADPRLIPVSKRGGPVVDAALPADPRLIPVSKRKSAGANNLRRAGYDRNPLLAFLATHGMRHKAGDPKSLKTEFSPDRQIMVMGYGPVFRQNGRQLDEILPMAIQSGFLPQDATESDLEALIQSAVAGNRVAPMYTEDGAEQEIERRMRQQRMDQEDYERNQAQAFADLDRQASEELEGALRDLSDDDLAALSTAMQDGPVAEIDAESNTDVRSAMKALGFTDQEIDDATAQGQGAPGQDGASRGSPAEAAGQGQGKGAQQGSGAPPASRADDEGLTDDEANTRAGELIDRHRAEFAKTPSGMTADQFHDYQDRRRDADKAVAAEILKLAGNGDGLLLPWKSGTSLIALHKDPRTEGAWRTTTFLPDMTPAGHMEFNTPMEAAAFFRDSAKGKEPAGLTAPTRADVLRQQDRAENAQALDDKAQIDREAEGFQLQTQTVDTRTDNTGDMFGGPSVDDYQQDMARRRKPGTEPQGPGLFDQPAEPDPGPQAAITPEQAANLTRGTIVKDGKGVEYYAWSARFDRLDVMPMKDGKPEVFAGNAIRFALTDAARSANPEYRTDPLYVVSMPTEAPTAAAPANRFEAGQALTKEQRKAVLASLVDVYKAKGAPREQKGIGADGNERYGYVHSPELFEKSDITGAMVRYYVTLPDGRIAHPSELFPNYTQADIDAAMAKNAADERNDADSQRRVEANAEQFSKPSAAEADADWVRRNPGPNALVDWRTNKRYSLVPMTKDGKFYSVRDDDTALMKRLERAGWVRADAAGNQAEPAAQATAILDAANVTGKDRLDILKDVKSGALTPDEVQAAFPGVEPAKKGRLTDAGEELIRNRRGKLKGLAWDDVSAMNDTLKVAQVIKSNVWPRPDYAKMVEEGAPAWKAAALKAVYDKLAAAPATRAAPTDSDLRAYIETMGQVRETLMAELDRVERDGTGDKLWASLQSRNVFGKVFPIPADAKPVFGAPSPFDRKSEQGKENNRRALLIGGNGAIQALQFNYKVTSKVKDLLSEGFPAKQEAWQKSYEVRPTETRDNYVPEGERTGEPQQRFYVYEKGSRWRLAKGVQDGGYATQEQAEAFARTLTAKKRDVLPPSRGLDLADVSRTGPDWRKGQNVTADQVMKHFGFRGVNLGEYVKAKQDVAQAHLNHAFDAFNDLADLLGVPPKAMSLNGTLGVAIGAQGSGKALAHFVPGVNEINITRDSGAGALAHEFGHAVDHYFATQHGRAASMAKRPYLSAVVENVNDAGGVRPEVMGAMRTVMKAINTRPMTEAEAKKYMADQRALNERRMDRWVAEFKGNRGADPEALAAVAEKLKRGDVGEVRDDDVETNLAEFMRAAGFKPGNMLAANAFTTAYRLRDLADEARFMATHIPQMETNYSKASAALDAKKTGDGYWGTPWEKFARAFETFVMDALADRQRESLYLSGLVDSKGWQSWSDATGKTIPYPAGDERLVMQQAFQKLVDTIQTREDGAGNVAMFARSEGNSAYTVLDDPDAKEAAAVEAGVEGKSAAEAADFLAGNATDPSHRLIAERVAKRLRQLEAVGSKFILHIAHDGAEVPATMIGAGIRGQVIQKPNDPETHIWVQGADMTGKVGTSYETVLHELLHAATQKAIDLGEYGATGDIGIAVRELFKVTEHVQGILREKLKSGDDLNDFEQTLAKAQNNSMANLHEMVTWALTNKETQKYLESIPYKSGNLWTEFVAAVRRFLGLAAGADTALSEVLRVSDKLLSIDAGRLLAESITQGVHMQVNYPGRRGIVNSARSVVNESIRSNRPDLAQLEALLRAVAPGRSETAASVRDMVSPLSDKWNIPVTVVQRPDQLPVPAPSDARGMYHNGAIYLVASNLNSRATVMRTLGHEAIAHHGLREMLGDEGFSAMMRQINLAVKAGNPAMRKISEYVRRVYVDEQGNFNLTPEQEADEIAARAVEDGIDPDSGEFRPGFGWLKAVFSRVAQFLRDLGITVPMSNTELQGVLVNSMRGLEVGAKLQGQNSVMAAARKGNQTDSAETAPVVNAPENSMAVRNLNAVMRGAGWEVEYVDIDLTAENPKAAIRVNRNDGRFLIAKVDAQGRASFETFQRERSLRMDPGQKGRRPLSPMVDDTFLGRQRFEGARSMLRGMTNYLADNALNPTALSDMRSAWAGVMTGPVKQDAALPAPAFDPKNPDIRFARSAVTGKTSRQHTPEQLRAMKNVGFQVEVPTLKERAQALWKDAGKKMAQGIVDQFAPVKDLDKDAYALMRLSKGASGAFETFLHGGKLKLSDNVYDFDETAKGGVVDKLLIPLQGEHHDFMRWVAANRAERLTAEGRENLFSPQDIADLKTLANGTTQFDYTIQTGAQAGRVTRDRAMIYADSLRVFNGFNKNVLDMAEQSGLIDPESRKLWEHEFYVPFYRVADDDNGGIRGANIKGGVVRQAAFKQLKGGKNALNADLLDNTLMNWAHLLDAAAKNRAAKATIEAAEKMGVAAPGNQSTLAQMATSINNKHGVVWFMDGGQKRYSLVDDPFLMTALTSLEYAGMRNPVMNAMGAFKHALTVGVTASPFFKIRNLIRDSVTVIGTSNISPNLAGNVAKGWALTDPKSDAYFRLLAGGGTIHFGTMLEGSEAKRVQALVESGVDDATILGDQNKVKLFYRRYIEPGITAYNELGNRGEAINRASLYDQLRKQGMSHADASLQARDLMDFSMQGTFTTIRFLTQTVPFMNARLQGLYKLGRGASENPARFAAVVGASALMSIALLAAYSDDDEWKKREEWDRNNFWWFKFGGIAFRIPKPFEIGAIATLAERGFELAFDKEMTGERFRKQVMTLLSDNLSMNPVPQLIKPIIDVYSNKDSFSGRPIESMSMERLKSEYRYTDRTSMLARGASTAMNSVTGLVGAETLSPVQIDHMLRGYFGWLGAFVVGAGDVIARPATDQPTRAAPDYWKVATGGIISDTRDAPSRYVSQMYDQAREVEQAYGTWRALQREGKVAEAGEFAKDNADKLAKYRKISGIKRTESRLNERIRIIERSNMDPDTKREAIRALQVQKDRAARALTA